MANIRKKIKESTTGALVQAKEVLQNRLEGLECDDDNRLFYVMLEARIALIDKELQRRHPDVTRLIAESS